MGEARSGTAAGRVTLRETRWQDIAALAALERELFADQAWSEASWWGELAARPRRAYVSACRTGNDVSAGGAGGAGGAPDTAAGSILGYAGVDRGGDVADVMTIAVTPAARGLGLGRVLLRRLIELAAPAQVLMLEVRADNPAARALYDSEGFEVVTVRRRYYGEVDALVMRRLTPPGVAAENAAQEVCR